jgi:hypothetical protein
VRAGFTRLYIAASVLVCLTFPLSAQTRSLAPPAGRDLPPFENAERTTFCDVHIPPVRRQGLSSPWGMPDGEPLSFRQTPLILRADHGGSIVLLEFAVLGDYPTLTLERTDESVASGDIQQGKFFRWVQTYAHRFDEGRVLQFGQKASD